MIREVGNENSEINNVTNNERVFDSSIKLKDNALLKHRPEIFSEWDFEKNGALGLDIYKITQSSAKVAWWNCPICSSPYDMRTDYRGGKQKSNCPYCSGRRVNHTNSLASLFPKIAKEWHPTLNNELTVNDVHGCGGKLVWWLCPKCESPYDMMVDARTGKKKSNCPYCRGYRVNHTNSLASLRPVLTHQWHPILNGDKSPHDFTCGSNRIAWWLCEKGHEWDTGIDNRSKENGTDCPYCSGHKVWRGFNDVWTVNPVIAEMLLNPEDGYKYTQSSNVKVDWKCLSCENIIKNKQMNEINQRGLSCPKCSDGVSFGEKFIYNLLKEAGIKFEFDVAQEWSQGKRFDFYFEYKEKRYIVEAHGVQHYGRGFEGFEEGVTLKEQQSSDSLKEKLANENGIESYIIIDCRRSTVEWISHGILNSDIIKIAENVDFKKIGQLATNSFVKKVCNLWSSGIHSVPELREIMNMSRNTVVSYLKKGAEIGWCDYCPKEAMKDSGRRAGTLKRKPVVQLDKELKFMQQWDSRLEAGKSLDINKCSISNACTGITKTAGGFKWMYKEDYDKAQLEKLQSKDVG